MNSTSQNSISPAGPVEPVSSMDRFEAAVKKNRAEYNEAMQRRELAHARTGAPAATLRQRRALSAVTRGKNPPPRLPINRPRSIPIVMLAQDQENEYGEFSNAALASKLLQATMHNFPLEIRGRAWAEGKRRGLVRDTIPYAKYIDSELGFAGPIPSYTQDPDSFDEMRPKVRFPPN